MLVVTSNWCVSDGTLAAGPQRGLVDRFRAEVRRSSRRSGFRRDGSYRPVDAVDIVLAGDSFDWLVSREWTGSVRPWDDGPRSAAAWQRVAAGSLRRGSRLLATLAGWMRRGIEVPLADRRGRPLPAITRPVPVRVTFLCGDRDRRLEALAAAAGLPVPGPVVGRCWSDGTVLVRHGAELDPLHGLGGGEPTLGESLAVDLIGRFGRALDSIGGIRPLAAGLLRRLAGGCPLEAPTRLNTWIVGHDRGTPLPSAVRQGLVAAWHRSVELWHRAARQLTPRGDDGVDLVDRIAECLALQAAPTARSLWLPSDSRPDSRPDLPGAAAPRVILGHPAAGSGRSAAWRQQVVCLGTQALRSCGEHDDDLQLPAAVVACPGRDGLQIDWLSMDGVARRAGGRDHGLGGADQRGRRGVWLSDVSEYGDGIVDAA
jgi:hypothetical protein